MTKNNQIGSFSPGQVVAMVPPMKNDLGGQATGIALICTAALLAMAIAYAVHDRMPCEPATIGTVMKIGDCR